MLVLTSTFQEDKTKLIWKFTFSSFMIRPVVQYVCTLYSSMKNAPNAKAASTFVDINKITI